MRAAASKFVVALVATATVALGSWLLLAEPSLGRMRNPQAAAIRAQRAVRPNSHGYGGYSGVCASGTLRPLDAPESFIHRGRVRCFESSGNPSGDNADLSAEAFLANEDGTIVNMTKDSRRCVEGSSNGNRCASDADCREGSCQDTTVLACTADARGRLVVFIFDGNPTGQNPDLGDELFGYDTRSGLLTQLTVQHGWCNDDPSHVCDKSSDCAGSFCARARMIGTQRFGGYGGPSSAPSSGLEVSPDGDLVWFVTDGDPGGNPVHAVTQFVLVTQGADKGLRPVASGGKFCSARTKHPGMPCTTPIECGPVCGDGRLDAGEECEPFQSPSTCPTGQFCRFPGTPDECTCVTPVCGNGVREPGEFCDGPFFCFPPLHCNGTCTACVLTSPSGAFVDPAS